MNAKDRGGPVKLGALYSTTGVAAQNERLFLSATRFAVSEVNAAGGIDGREVKIVHFDPGSDPVYYGYLAEKLIKDESVDLIFGCYMSSARLAIKPVVEQHDGLLFYPSQYEGFEYSRNIIYGGAVANQNCALLANFISRNAPPRVYMVGSAYIWPRESARTMSELVTGQGGQVVGQAFFKLNAIREDFDDLISNIRQIDPDVIFCNLVGPSISLFYQAYAAAGLDPAKMPIVSLTTSEISIQDMGPANAIGHITAASYFQSVETEANRMTLDRFGKWIDRPFVTDMGWEAAYSQVRMVCDAIAKTGTPHVEQIRAALLDASYDAPQGRIRIDEETNHTYLWPRIGRANSEGQFDIVQESGAIVKPDPYLTSHQDVAGDMIYEI